MTDKEKDIVYHGPAEKKHIFYKAKTDYIYSRTYYIYNKYNKKHTTVFSDELKNISWEETTERIAQMTWT